MTRRRAAARGFSLTEAMVTVAIIGALFGILPRIVYQIMGFFTINMDRLALQRDARISTEILVTRLRQADATTILVDRSSATSASAPDGQPPYSRIRFMTVSGSTITVWQEGRNLFIQDAVSSPRPRVITPLVRYLAFTYVGTMDDAVMSVNLCLEKESFRRRRIFYVTNDRVRILNE